MVKFTVNPHIFVGRANPINEFGQTGWLARRLGSEKRHWKSGALASLGPQKLLPVSAGRPLVAKASRSVIQKWLKLCLAA